MQNNSQKLASIFLYLIVAVSVVLLGIFYYKTTGLSLPEEATFQEEINAYGSVLDLFIGWAYVLIAIGAAAAIIPSIIMMVTQPKNAVKSVISIVVIAVIVLIAYVLSDGTPLDLPGYTGNDNVPSMLKFGDTMIFTMYFLLAGAVLSQIYSGVAKMFK
jgi:hypothetical protein